MRAALEVASAISGAASQLAGSRCMGGFTFLRYAVIRYAVRR
jgi:hypothetical protein